MSDREEISILLDIYGSLLTENRQNCVDLYYNEDLSLSEIAENQGITRQGVRDNIQRAVKQLKLYDEALGLRNQYSEIRSGLEEIAELAQTVKEINMNTALSREINDAVTRISTIAKMLNE